jgi:ubiquitin carboxyl-terminal hydrolase 7
MKFDPMGSDTIPTDIQLNVKNLQESFQNYLTVETLEGENGYQAEGYGLQGVIF